MYYALSKFFMQVFFWYAAFLKLSILEFAIEKVSLDKCLPELGSWRSAFGKGKKVLRNLILQVLGVP